VTHDQKEALSIGDRRAVLGAGRVCQIGAPREVYRRPRDRFVADFLGETNFIEGEIIRADAGEAFVRTAVGDFQGALAEASAAPAAGARVTVSIRPECLRLVEAPAEENSVAGRVGRFTYFGEVAHYEFQTDGPAPLTLRLSELNPREWTSARDQPLYAYADPEDVVVLTA
jgi:spermidine/putrescine transport system ATP-binding protein